MTELEPFKKIIKEAGKNLCNMSSFKVIEKTGINDIVTSCDKATQDFLIKELSAVCPDASFLCEENDVNDITGKHFFIIDPIDGTTNFVKHYNHSCISVAYADHKEIIWGIVYNPYTDELYEAYKDKGAYLNEKRIHVTEHDLSHSIISFGTSPYYKELREASFKTAYELMDKCLDIRRSGSAALDLCYAADGRCGLFFEYLLSPWDYAAGMCIVKEAGGIVLDFDKNIPDYTKKSAIAAGSIDCVESFFGENK